MVTHGAQATLASGLAAPVLVLNRSFLPVRITTARDALVMLFLGRARALDAAFEPHDFDAWRAMRPLDGDESIGTIGGSLKVPRVLQLTTFNRVPRATVRLSRRNIYLRDDHTCQYCGDKPGTRDLNLDHVMPRSRGGRSSWDNLVTSCRDCNLEKGGMTPEEAGMRLRRKPVQPAWSAVAHLSAGPRRFSEWEPFLGTAPLADAGE